MNCIEDEFDDISSRTWSRAVESIAKNGYKEGAIEGRDSAFQDSFDLGYKEGFKYGMNLGLHRALQRVHFQNPTEDTSADPQKINCQTCLNRELLQQHVINIDNTQRENNKPRIAEMRKEIDNVLVEVGTYLHEILNKLEIEDNVTN